MRDRQLTPPPGGVRPLSAAGEDENFRGGYLAEGGLQGGARAAGERRGRVLDGDVFIGTNKALLDTIWEYDPETPAFIVREEALQEAKYDVAAVLVANL